MPVTQNWQAGRPLPSPERGGGGPLRQATQPELTSSPLPFLILGAGAMELPLVLAARPREDTGSLGEDSMPWAPPGE